MQKVKGIKHSVNFMKLDMTFTSFLPTWDKWKITCTKHKDKKISEVTCTKKTEELRASTYTHLLLPNMG